MRRRRGGGRRTARWGCERERGGGGGGGVGVREEAVVWRRIRIRPPTSSCGEWIRPDTRLDSVWYRCWFLKKSAPIIYNFLVN